MFSQKRGRVLSNSPSGSTLKDRNLICAATRYLPELELLAAVVSAALGMLR